MNIFFLKDSGNKLELITPPLDGTILPGITRDSIIQLVTNNYPQIKVIEKDYYIEELIYDINNDSILEIFGTGTAAIISPVSKFEYSGKIYCTKNKIGKLTRQLHDILMDIQYGKIKNHFNWSKIIT